MSVLFLEALNRAQQALAMQNRQHMHGLFTFPEFIDQPVAVDKALSDRRIIQLRYHAPTRWLTG